MYTFSLFLLLTPSPLFPLLSASFPSLPSPFSLHLSSRSSCLYVFCIHYIFFYYCNCSCDDRLITTIYSSPTIASYRLHLSYLHPHLHLHHYHTVKFNTSLPLLLSFDYRSITAASLDGTIVLSYHHIKYIYININIYVYIAITLSHSSHFLLLLQFSSDHR